MHNLKNILWGNDAVIVMYSVTDRMSFKAVEHRIADIRSDCTVTKDLAILLVGYL